MNLRAFVFLLFFVSVLLGGIFVSFPTKGTVLSDTTHEKEYWMMLHRKSNKEFLYHGVPGVAAKSKLIKEFVVKSGIPRERPTPLPNLLGREYWLITEKFETPDNPETAPYFLKLDIPYSEEFPYGPTPYEECNGPASPTEREIGQWRQRGEQCNWELPGSFGLHGVGGESAKISPDDPGSSGCVRHSDEDIRYLFNLLDPKSKNIRYYIEDK